MTRGQPSAIAAANRGHFADGEQVEAYLDQRHHIARIDRMLALLKDGPRARVLDVGSSPAIAGRLAAAAREVTALSLEADELTWPASVRPVTADCARGLPFPTERFDVLFCGELIEHLFDPIAFLKEAARVLAPGGRLILSTPNLATLQDRAIFCFGHSPRQIDPLHPYLWLHIRPFTRDMLKRCLVAAGFEIIRLATNYVEIVTSKRRLALPLIGKLFPGLGGSLIVEARRRSASA